MKLIILAVGQGTRFGNTTIIEKQIDILILL